MVGKELYEPKMKRMTRREIKVGGHSCQNWQVKKRATRWIALVVSSCLPIKDRSVLLRFDQIETWQQEQRWHS
jgi:hypothetical protein